MTRKAFAKPRNERREDVGYGSPCQSRKARGGDSTEQNSWFGFHILAQLDWPHWASGSTAGSGQAERIIVTSAVAILWLGSYRTSTRPRLPSGAQFATCVAFYRRELERRRNYFAKPWLFGIVILIALVLPDCNEG